MRSKLEIDSVLKSFNYNQILTDIYLKIQTGEVVGILGRNGCGKSTLLKILFGTLRAEYKFIRVDGKTYNRPYTKNDLINYMPQFNFLPKQLKVKKIIQLYLDKENAITLMKDEIIQPLLLNKAAQLSGGELRYLEILLLLNKKSKFILLDEPFNGISPILVESIKVQIRKFSKHKGILVTDHDYRNVLDIADRLCLMYDGGIKEINNKEELVRWGYISQTRLQSLDSKKN